MIKYWFKIETMKHLLKLTILPTLLILSTLAYSQMGSRRGQHQQGQGQGQQANQPIEAKMNIKNIAGVNTLDEEEIIKKLKIAKKDKPVVIAAIDRYNNKMREIRIFNFDTFNEAEKYLKKKKEEAMQSRDPYVMKDTKIRLDEILAPVKEKVKEQRRLLTAFFKKNLSEKQFEKWVKYQKKLHSKNKSTTNSTNNNNAQHKKRKNSF